jgi:hypothetical protein
VPAELTEQQLRDAIAVMGERHEHGAQAAESVLEWLGWEGEGPLLLRRYDVQQLAWYTLPCKFLTGLEDKRETAELVAYTLDHLGDLARGYAEVCRSPATDELLRAWEVEDPTARHRFRELMEASGIEPPDTDLLAWGRVMGFDEARVRDRVATALEQAIEDGRLTPGARGFRRVQAQVAIAALMEPWEDDERRTQLDAVHAERLERWARHGNARGSDARNAILEPVLPLRVSPLEPVSSDAARAVLHPALWVMDQALTGVALTQTGALNRGLVREIAERWPDWWAADLFGSPNREDDIPLLGELHDLLRRARLLRRTGRRLILTTRGHALAADPPELLRTLARSLLAGDTFDAACGELAVALILNGAVIDYTPHLADRLRPAIVAAGWQAGGEPPNREHVSWTIADLLRPAEALGLLAPVPGDTRLRSGPLLLADVGRLALTDALRARAVGPANGPF